MGFLRKAWNFITGKGFQEDEIEPLTETPTQTTEPKDTTLTQAEDLKQPEKKRKEVTLTTPSKEKLLKPVEKLTEIKKPQVQQAAKAFEQAGNIQSVERELPQDMLNTVSFTPTTSINDLNNVYNKLLSRSTISTIEKDGTTDQALINVIIENRQKLQHRFSADITIQTNKGEASFSIDGILAENLSSLEGFIRVGQSYTSQELKMAMEEAQTYYEKQYGSIGGGIKVPPSTKVTIQSINITMTFG